MGIRIWYFLLLVLSISQAYADTAGSLEISNVSCVQMNNVDAENEFQISEAEEWNESVCKLCEMFASHALYYLHENQTQKVIIDALHQTCAGNHECMTLVDHYASIFFRDIGKIQPRDLCNKLNLCDEEVSASLQKSKTLCSLCRCILSALLGQFSNPDVQLEIIGVLLKGCNLVEKYLKSCKEMTIKYGPLLLDGLVQCIIKLDICSVVHICEVPVPPHRSEVLSPPQELFLSKS